MTPFPLSRRAALAGLAALATAGLGPARAEARTLRIGIMAGEDEDVWRAVAVHAAQSGLTLKIVTFSDYTGPDEALAEHELDANAFQHRPYLDAQIKAHGFHIVPVGDTYFSPIGLYSSKYKSPDALPHGARIGVPNDPSNEGRALRLLESLKLIKLDPSTGLLPTALDITDNPRDVSVKELDAGIVGRALTDLDAAVVNTNWAFKAGIDIAHERIAQEALDGNPYVNFIAVNAEDEKAPWVAPLVAAFHQPDVRQAILTLYRGTIVPAWPAQK